jgi:hypothetical protein
MGLELGIILERRTDDVVLSCLVEAQHGILSDILLCELGLAWLG